MYGFGALVVIAACAVATVEAESKDAADLPTVDLGYAVHRATINVSPPDNKGFSYVRAPIEMLRILQTNLWAFNTPSYACSVSPSFAPLNVGATSNYLCRIPLLNMPTTTSAISGTALLRWETSALPPRFRRKIRIGLSMMGNIV